MISHDRFLEFAAVEIDFPLARDEHDALERHLASCAACRTEASALRADARAIAELPRPRLDAVRADQLLGNALVRRARRPNLRHVAVAALLALLTLGALAVGAELLRETIRPPLVVVTPPSIAPSTLPGPVSDSSSPVTSWQAASIGETGSLPEDFTAVASSGSTYVTVGGTSCTSSSDGLSGCWAEVYRSIEGRKWTKADTAQSSLAVGTAITLSGPRPGMIDVAGGGGGFVAIGFAGDDVVKATVWQSIDGLIWERLPDEPFTGADLRAVVNLSGRWVVAGTIVADAAPRGAMWWSDDGKAWNRVPDAAVFDVGGYIDTGESSGAGGVRALATDGTRIVGVGSACDPDGASCAATIWTSVDGIRWERQDGRDLPGAGALVGGFVAHGNAGFVVMGSSCSVTGCVGTGLRSPDGRSWTEISQVGLGEIRAIAAVGDGFVVATPTQATPPGLALLASTDGRTWIPLDGIPTVEGGVLSAVDMVPALDGRVIAVVRFEVHDGPSTSTVLEVGPPGR